MSSISSLLQALPKMSQSRMIGSGFGLWIVWSGELNTAVPHTLKDYGAIPMVEQEGQALWLSPTPEVFRALGRLQIWARLNPMPMLCQVIPVTVLVGYDLTLSMALPSECSGQAIESTKDFEVWVHPKLVEVTDRISGLRLASKSALSGMSKSEWKLFEADEGLDYETVLNWFFVIRPVGRKGEKDSIMGWRAWAEEIKNILSRQNMKYLVGTREEVLIVALKDLRSLRVFMSEVLKLIAEVKDNPDKNSWPCVMAATPQKGKQFTEEISHKFNLDWNKLTPDLPHLSYREAFMLGSDFQINEARYGGEESLASWCNVGLISGLAAASQSAAEIILPRKLMQVIEEQECFYCGFKDHHPRDCPTRRLKNTHQDVWSTLARMDIKEFPKGMVKLDQALDTDSPLENVPALLTKDKGPEHIFARALYETNVSAQLRMLTLVWRCRGKEWPQGFKKLAPQEGQFVAQAVEALLANDYERSGTLLKQARLKHSRSYIPSSLQGFLAMEVDDHHQAQFYWQEAERLAFTPLQQGYFQYLQARSMEIEGNFKEAASMYRRAFGTSPKWLDPLYRSGVCMVKLGFTGQAINTFVDIIGHNPNLFNRILIDPELDRGRSHVLAAMWDQWAETEALVKEERERLVTLGDELEVRFDEDHEFFEPANEALDRMRKLAKIDNFVAFKELIRNLTLFKEKLTGQVEREVKRIHAKVDYLVERLKDIQKEASWFPFPKLLLDFNKDFNFCVEKINWINRQHIKASDKFREARHNVEDVAEKLENLQSRLVTLRIIRDSTLFVLMLGRTFIWFEIVGLGLALVGLPLTVYLTRNVESLWFVDMIREQQWEFQKGLLLILSGAALILALLKTAMGFEKKKRELFMREEDDE